MTTHTWLRLGAVAFVLLIVVLLSGAHLCGVALERSASDPGMRPIGSGALACPEFWLYRYQTLIAALIAGSIALWAGRLLFRQVETQRFDFLSRQISELQNISSAANELWAACNGPIGPRYAIRFSGEPAPLSLLGTWEVKATDFWTGIKNARDAIVRLETYARRPIGPSLTARQAEMMSQYAGEYLRICESDAFSQFGMGFLGSRLNTDLRQRSLGTNERHAAMADAFNELANIYVRESAQLAGELARAHSAAR